jgi:cobaltochelatase CobN
MHLVRIDAVSLDEGEAAVDLGQEPGDLVMLSFTDSDLAGIARAYAAEPGLPSLRLAKMAKLRHPLSVDFYVERVVARAKIVVIRCLGGLDYWRYGVERCAEAARAHGVVLAVLPGDDRPDSRLAASSTDPALADRLDAYFRAGGPENLRQMLRLLASRIGADLPVEPPRPLPRGFAWCPGCTTPPLDQAVAAAETAIPLADARAEPLALLLVYRSAVLGGDTAPFVALIAALRARGIGVLPMAVSSLKEPVAAAAVAAAVRTRRPDLVIAATRP